MNKILIWVVLSLVFMLFIESSITWTNHAQAQLPDYVLRVPQDHFVGISAPSKNIREARMSSINNAMEQIIRAMGATYSLNYKDRTYGNVVAIKREIEDDLEILAGWFVKAVEQNIVKSDFVTNENNFYIFFTLIRFPDEKIEEMRKLTIGPKVMARIVETDGNVARIEMAEINGVPVTIYEYEINAETFYKRADFVSYYIYKVPKSKTINYCQTLEMPLILNSSCSVIEVSIPSSRTDFWQSSAWIVSFS